MVEVDWGEGPGVEEGAEACVPEHHHGQQRRWGGLKRSPGPTHRPCPPFLFPTKVPCGPAPGRGERRLSC